MLGPIPALKYGCCAPGQDLVGPLQQAFVLGLQQPQLAGAALARLELWEASNSSRELLAQVHPRKAAGNSCHVHCTCPENAPSCRDTLCRWCLVWSRTFTQCSRPKVARMKVCTDQQVMHRVTMAASLSKCLPLPNVGDRGKSCVLQSSAT